jgi:hypothetical protein
MMVERMTGSSEAIRQVAKSQPPSRRAPVIVSWPRSFLVGAFFLAGAFLAGAFFAGAFLASAFLAGGAVLAAGAFLAGALFFFFGMSAMGPPGSPPPKSGSEGNPVTNRT